MVLLSNIKLSLDKTMVSTFKIYGYGNAEVNCIRCGTLKKVDLWDEFNMVKLLRRSNKRQMRMKRCRYFLYC
jgi:hypothetical protein